MILVYTGAGKGKTSAALGQVVRALGYGFRVVFLQFLKRDNQAGEQFFLKKYLQDDFLTCGLGFILNEEDRKKQRNNVSEVLLWLENKIKEKPFLLVLDEVLYSLHLKVIRKEELEHIINLAQQENVHLVLTGRNFPPYLWDKVDLISEIKEVKHPFQEGIKAKKGIDF